MPARPRGDQRAAPVPRGRDEQDRHRGGRETEGAAQRMGAECPPHPPFVDGGGEDREIGWVKDHCCRRRPAPRRPGAANRTPPCPPPRRPGRSGTTRRPAPSARRHGRPGTRPGSEAPPSRCGRRRWRCRTRRSRARCRPVSAETEAAGPAGRNGSGNGPGRRATACGHRRPPRRGRPSRRAGRRRVTLPTAGGPDGTRRPRWECVSVISRSFLHGLYTCSGLRASRPVWLLGHGSSIESFTFPAPVRAAM